MSLIYRISFLKRRFFILNVLKVRFKYLAFIIIVLRRLVKSSFFINSTKPVPLTMVLLDNK